MNFVVAFSQPVDTDAIEDSFTIHSFNSTLIAMGDTTISGNTAAPDSSDIWSQGGYDAEWNSDNTEVTFLLPENQQLNGDGNQEVYLSFKEKAEADGDPTGWWEDFETPLVIANPNEVDGAPETGIFQTRLIRVLDSDPQRGAALQTEIESVGFPRFEPSGSFNTEPDLTIFEDGFMSGNISTWSHTQDP